ncbi:MAG TPA: TadE/TadG family type IV pilus assembly protein [Paracoccaceae bacterium]
MAETLIVLPIVTLFAIAVLEFGSVFWQRQQLQTGVRDAARYWSRCRPDFSNCSLTIARNIAFYGNPSGSGSLRVPNWNDASELDVTPATPPGAPEATDLVTVTGTLVYEGSPLIGKLSIPVMTITYQHTERYIGW